MITIFNNSGFSLAKSAYENSHEVTVTDSMVFDETSSRILIRTHFPDGYGYKLSDGVTLEDITRHLKDVSAKSGRSVQIKKINEKAYDVCEIKICRRTG